jgi:hypothetical protein
LPVWTSIIRRAVLDILDVIDLRCLEAGFRTEVSWLMSASWESNVVLIVEDLGRSSDLIGRKEVGSCGAR